MRKVFFCYLLLMAIVTGRSQQVLTTFMKSSLVIGQTTFKSNATTINSVITYSPSHCAVSSKGMLAVAEQAGSCVKIWYKIPKINGQPADVVVGDTSFTTTVPVGATQSNITICNGVAWSPDGNKLIATDLNNNRVLIWDSVPNINGEKADHVIGQDNFTTSAAGLSSRKLNSPLGVMVAPDGRLLVSESVNNRVLIWNSIPKTNGVPADVVIGQPDFTTATSGNTDNKLYCPWGMSKALDGRLLIADEKNNRILIYDSIPRTNNASAKYVMGQTAFGLNASGLSQSKFYYPIGVTVTVDGKVAVAEYYNNRVMIFDSVPKSNGINASVVLGQPNFTTNTQFYPSGSIDTANMYRTYGICSDLNGRLFVAGRDMNRVMVFGKLPTSTSDLKLTMSGTVKTSCTNRNIRYAIKIKNMGPDTAKNIIASAKLPADFIQESDSLSGGSYNKVSGYWSIPFIKNNDSSVLVIRGTISPSSEGKTLMAYANILSSRSLDTSMNNNAASISVSVAIPSAPAVSGGYVCKGSFIALTALKGSPADTLRWFQNLTDVNPLDTGKTFTTPAMMASDTFYVEAKNICISKRVAVQVFVYPDKDTLPAVYTCLGDSVMIFGKYRKNAGFYNDTLTSSHGCGDSIVTRQLKLYSKPLVSFPDVTICANDSALIFGEYRKKAATYYDTLSTNHGCDSILSLKLIVNSFSLNNLTDINLCQGDSVIVFGQKIKTSGTFSDTLIAYNGCDSVLRQKVNLIAVDTSLTIIGKTITAKATGSSFRWIDCISKATVAGQTAASFTPAKTGSYAAEVTTNDCTDTSRCIGITVLSIMNESTGLNAYPNPATDYLNVTLGEKYDVVTIRLSDAAGSVLINKQYFDVDMITINLKDFAHGIYFLRITSEDATGSIRIIKQ